MNNPSVDRTAAPANTQKDGSATSDVPLENFIPVSRLALLERLSKAERLALPGEECESCKKLFRYLSIWRHQTYQKRLARLKRYYLPFSPDRDTKRVRQHDPKRLKEYKNNLIKEVNHLLVQANFDLIDKKELERLLQTNSVHGLELNVDLGEFDEVMIYARGLEIETIEKRLPEHFYRKKEFKVPIYQRLFLLLKLKSVEQRVAEIMEEHKVSEKKARKINKKQRRGLPDDPEGQYVYLRLFKNIPQEDLEMMFPNTQVKLCLFDKIKLGITAGGGTLAGLVGAASKIASAFATANPIGLAVAIFGLVGVIFRQIMSVFNTRTKYMMMLAQRLFFHSLANNRGVLTLLVDRAEEEDVKEDMLFYFFLLRHPMPDRELGEEGKLDEMIEEYLADQFGVEVDFDIRDPLDRLNKDHMLVRGKDGLIYARPPEEACRLLEYKWRASLTSEEVNEDDDEFEGDV